MSKEIDKGFFSEFKRTPEEQRQVDDRNKIKELEQRVEILEKLVASILKQK